MSSKKNNSEDHRIYRLQIAIESRYPIAEKIRNRNSLLGKGCISILSLISLFDKKYKANLMRAVEELYERFRSYVHDEITIDRDDYLEEMEPV